MPTDDATFEDRRGRRLAARYERPSDRDPAATVLLAHCFTCGKDLKGLVRLSRTLTELGFGVLRLDFAGLGESEGDMGEQGIGGDAEALIDAAAWLSERGDPPALLIGHSAGGLAALSAAPEIASLRAVATIGSPADPEHLTQTVDDRTVSGDDGDDGDDGSRTVQIGPRTLRLPASFFSDLASRDMQGCLNRIEVPLLIAHGPDDEIVGIDQAERLFAMATHPKSFLSLGKAAHLLPREADARFVAYAVGGWALGVMEQDGGAS
ncbi:MAG: alpha/beta fold hydrolase, partial [Trueperaceae bacterium]